MRYELECLMQTAIYGPEDTEYTAEDFLALGASAIAQRRRSLICPNDVCRVRASFVSPSSDGRAAHFSAKHKEGCDYTSTPSERFSGDEGRPVDVVRNAGQRIVVELDVGAEVERHSGPDASSRSGDATPRYVVDPAEGGRRNTASHRKLMPLFRDVVRSASYRASNQIVVIPGYPELPVRRFFVPFGRGADNRYDDAVRGWWGEIDWAAVGSKTGQLWIGIGRHYASDFRVLVTQDKVESFLARCGARDPEDLRSGHLLVLGTRKRSAVGAYVRVDSMSETAFRPAAWDPAIE